MSNFRVVNGIQKAYMPGYGVDADIPGYITVDDQNALRTRGTVMTDEGGYTTNYSTSALSIGTCTFTSGSNIVTGTNFSSYDLCVGDYVKYDAEDITNYTAIESFTDTELVLEHPYSGAGGTGLSYSIIEKPKVGTGASVAYTSGAAVFTVGTTASSICELERDVDIIPLVIEKEVIISQRIANQDIYLGCYSEDTPSRYWAWFQFTGTDNRTVITETAYSRVGAPTSFDKETNIVALPNNSSTGVANRYRIEMNNDVIRFLINDTIVATHKRVLMRAAAFMTSTLRIVNGTTPATSTTVTCNWSRAYNYNKLSVGLLDKDSALFTSEIPKESDSCIPVRVAPQKTWRPTFGKVLSNTVDSTYFNLIKTGGSQTIAQAAGSLTIVTGTSANSESIIRSNRSWTDSFILKASVATTAARIANQNLFVEMVDVIGDNLACTINSATSVSITIPNNPFDATNIGQSMYIGNIANLAAVPGRYAIASISGNVVNFTVAGWPASGSTTVSLFGWNYHHILYDGAVVTSAKYDAQRVGWSSGDTSYLINTTTSAAGDPSHQVQLVNDDGTAYFSDGLVTTNAGVQMTQRGSRMANIPDAGVPLYLQIRCVNGSTAPVSTNTWKIGFVSIEEFAPVPVALHNIKQSGPGATAVSINTGTLTTVSTVSTLSAISAGTTLIGDVGIGARATTTNSLVLSTNTKHIVSASGANATAVKASAGRLYGVVASNATSAMKYIKFYNSASAPTSASTTVLTVGVPPNNSLEWHNNIGIYFGTGIASAFSTSMADTWDATGVGANELLGEILVG